jgi:hypothetical protein
MDVEVDVSNTLPGDHYALENAAIWLREHLNIPEQCTVFEPFEEYFNCRIDVDDRVDNWMQPNCVVFDNSKDLMAFLLKWS